jgi:hypothetical protein
MSSDPWTVRGRKDFEIHSSLYTKSTGYLFKTFPIFIFCFQLVLIILAKPIWLFAVFLPLIMLCAIIINRLFIVNGWLGLYKMPIQMAILGIILVSTNAYTLGFSMRHQPYSHFRDRPNLCGNSIRLLFSAGGYFIGVRNDGTRVAMDADCKQIMTFPKSSPYIDLIPI